MSAAVRFQSYITWTVRDAGKQEEEGSREGRRKRDLRQRDKEKSGNDALDLISPSAG